MQQEWKSGSNFLLTTMHWKLEKHCKFLKKSVISLYKKLKFIKQDLMSIAKSPGMFKKLQNYCDSFKNTVVSFYESLKFMQIHLNVVRDLLIIHQKINNYFFLFEKLMCHFQKKVKSSKQILLQMAHCVMADSSTMLYKLKKTFQFHVEISWQFLRKNKIHQKSHHKQSLIHSAPKMEKCMY